MAKTNFTKVESLLDKGAEKRFVEKLIAETGGASLPKGESIPKAYLIESLHWDIIALPEYDKNIFKKLGVTKKEIAKLIKNPASLTEKDWKLVREIRKNLNVLKKAILEAFPSPSNEDLVEYERLRHINKRFNVSDRWLPLH